MGIQQHKYLFNSVRQEVQKDEDGGKADGKGAQDTGRETGKGKAIEKGKGSKGNGKVKGKGKGSRCA